MAVYKKELRAMGGYLTDGSQPNLTRVEHFIQAVGSFEDKIFLKRARLHQRQSERIKRDKAQAKRGDDSEPTNRPDSLVPVARFGGSRLASGPSPSPYQQKHSSTSVRHNQVGQTTSSLSALDIKCKGSGDLEDKQPYTRAQKVARLDSGATIGAAIVEAEKNLEVDADENKEELKSKLKLLLREKNDVFNMEQPEEDKVKLGEPGWKDRYYAEKFSAESPEDLDAIRRDVVLKYTEGLCWVMHYYYEGVCSWQWFYPYHYAPFASDLKDLGQLNISFELGSPFKPFNQLLGVFPAASCHALPEQYRKLMTDPNSPIIDFYPTDFEVDMNGKRFAWQGIAKLPFIDERRLLAEVEKIEHTLTEEEARRNSVLSDMLFVSMSHTLSPYIFSLDSRCKQLTDKERVEVKEKIDPVARSTCSGGMNGYISLCSGDPCPPLFRSPIMGKEDIMGNQVICAIYRLPDVHKHITRPPPGVTFPEKIVTVGDLQPDPVLWHEDSGRRPFDNGRYNNTNVSRFGNQGRNNNANGPRFDNNGRNNTNGPRFDNNERNNNANGPRYDNSGRYNNNNSNYNNTSGPRHDNPNGAISGRQLGQAAHRLVVSSLPVRAENNIHGDQMYHPRAVGYVPPRHQPHHLYPPAVDPMIQASPVYSHHGPVSPVSYRQTPYAPPPPYNRIQDHPPPHHQPPHVRDYPRQNDRPVPHVRDYPRHGGGYHPRGPPQHSGRAHAPYPPPVHGGQTSARAGHGGQTSIRPGYGGQTSIRPGRGGQTSIRAGHAGQTSIRPGVYYHESEGDQSLGGGYNLKGVNGVPPVSASAGNHFSALGRGGSRRPPQSDHHRR